MRAQGQCAVIFVNQTPGGGRLSPPAWTTSASIVQLAVRRANGNIHPSGLRKLHLFQVAALALRRFARPALVPETAGTGSITSGNFALKRPTVAHRLRAIKPLFDTLRSGRPVVLGRALFAENKNNEARSKPPGEFNRCALKIFAKKIAIERRDARTAPIRTQLIDYAASWLWTPPGDVNYSSRVLHSD